MILTMLIGCIPYGSLSFADAMTSMDSNKYNLYYAFNSNKQFEKFINRGFSDKVESITFGWASLVENKEGALKLDMDTGDFRVPIGYAGVLEKAKDNNVQVYLNLYSKGPYDNMLGAIETLADEIRELINGTRMAGLEFDGIVLNLEGLSSSNQRDFSAFSWLVNAALKRDDKLVKIALQPGRGTEYNITNHFVDGYILMLHDYEPKYYNLPVNESKPVVTPLAPTNKILADLKSELELIGHKNVDKVAVQLNLATAQWKVKSGSLLGPDGTTLPYRPTYESLVQRMAVLERNEPEGFKRFDEGSPYLHYYDHIDETWNSIWYEDESSFDIKMKAANELGIRQFSVWRMGNLPEIERYNLDIPRILELYR